MEKNILFKSSVPGIIIGTLVAIILFNYSVFDDVTIRLLISLNTAFIVISILQRYFYNILKDDYNDLLKEYENLLKNPLPEVIKSFIFYNKDDLCLLLKESKLFSDKIMVSIYIYDNELEKLFARGSVIEIQENKRIKIRIHTNTIVNPEENAEHLRLIENNNVDLLKKIRVKPFVHTSPY